MAEMSWTTCDKCNPRQQIGGEAAYYEGDEGLAIDAGWILTDEGHICPDCQKDQEDCV